MKTPISQPPLDFGILSSFSTKQQPGFDFSPPAAAKPLAAPKKPRKTAKP